MTSPWPQINLYGLPKGELYILCAQHRTDMLEQHKDPRRYLKPGNRVIVRPPALEFGRPAVWRGTIIGEGARDSFGVIFSYEIQRDNSPQCPMIHYKLIEVLSPLDELAESI